eukprot:TRINITY_DN7224_c0_g1_i1.p2 TRINITY_DN7224_c0_g1~~TRINITY_DN7224_c0_g1_i1.p2  ORF type:complete len:157 (-),score=27.96 TRINITY_DN7224_c0_g1_i1:270-740(-)
MEAVITRDNATLLWGEVGPKPPLQILNFIQLHLRKWCFTQGAALVYTSTVSNLHVPLLRDLIAHHAFGTPIPPDGPSPKSDAVFIPAGRDSLPEIGLLEVSAMGDTPGNTPYSLVIRCPAPPRTWEPTRRCPASSTRSSSPSSGSSSSRGTKAATY